MRITIFSRQRVLWSFANDLQFYPRNYIVTISNNTPSYCLIFENIICHYNIMIDGKCTEKISFKTYYDRHISLNEKISQYFKIEYIFSKFFGKIIRTLNMRKRRLM